MALIKTEGNFTLHVPEEKMMAKAPDGYLLKIIETEEVMKVFELSYLPYDEEGNFIPDYKPNIPPMKLVREEDYE
jgi:hypothetical protein